jgi:hypothetical protein
MQSDAMKGKSIDHEEYDRLYEEQFRMAMSAVSCYHDIQDCIEKLEKEEDTKFFARRMRDNVQKIMQIRELT